jgi:ABC-type multidrug transport system ATPase subunit
VCSNIVLLDHGQVIAHGDLATLLRGFLDPNGRVELRVAGEDRDPHRHALVRKGVRP